MSGILFTKWGKVGTLLLLLFTLSFIIISCSDTPNDPISSGGSIQDETALSKENPRVRAVIEVQERHTTNLMEIPDVIGTAVGLTADGLPCILVLTKTDIKANSLAKGIANPIPAKLDNTPVEILVTGEIKAFKGGGVSHTAKQTAPIQLGTSGGWSLDLANGYCCGGTLGSLIKKNDGSLHILSNYHVLEADIVSGGNGTTAQSGQYVIQPGLIDINCNAATGQNVAKLSGIKSLPSSNVDAAIAQIIPGMVRTDGSILEIGTISNQTLNASLSLAVKKSGRTTGLTRSTISGLNATVNITYENECAGGTAFTKRFTGQIIINNKASRFLAGGDSGSLLVQDVTTNPKAVGLLFAGSSVTAVANPIQEVLNFFGATMVGN
jgi:hypothetical protein